MRSSSGSRIARIPLEEQAQGLSRITFHEKLGTVAQRHERFTNLANDYQGQLAASVELANIAAVVLEADLVTDMVGEFPELQGLMGGYCGPAEGLIIQSRQLLPIITNLWVQPMTFHRMMSQ